TDPRGFTTTYLYDGNRRLRSTEDALHNLTTTAYDSAGNVRTVQDALQRVTTTVYDGRNQLSTRTDPAGGVATSLYSAAGQLVQREDPKQRPADPRGRVASYVFDQRGWKRQFVDGAGDAGVQTRANYEYDAAGNLRFQTTGQSATPGY